MTVSSDVSQIEYTGDGATARFPIPFYFVQNADLAVYLKRASTGLVTKLLHGADYALTGAEDEQGGAATLSDVPLANDRLLIRRELDIVQETDYPPNSIFPAASQERALDRGTMVDQQLANLIARALVSPPLSDFFDAQGKRIIHLGNGIDAADAVNLGQLVDAVGGTGSPLGVAPKLWNFTGDGVTTDFPLAGADVFNALFYDTALAGEVAEPYTDFTVLAGGADTDPIIRFAAAPADGAKGFTVLRGYARAYNGSAPITSVASTVTIVDSVDGALGNAYQNSIVVVTSAVDTTLTIKKNTGAADDWTAGQFFSVMQLGAGKITLAVESGGTLDPSPGYLCETRGQNSIISATCLYADADQWAISGDLLAETATPDVQCFTLPCSDEATTDIAVADNVYRFQMPYGFLVTEVRATLNVAQGAGDPLTVDVTQNGTSIFSTLLTLDNAETTSTSASVPAVLANPDSATLADGDLIAVDVTQVGTAGARGLKVQLIGQRA